MTNIFSNMVLHYKNISFRNKLLLSYILFIIIPVIFIISLVLINSSSIIRKQTLSLAEISTKQSVERIEELINECQKTVSLILQDNTVRTILEKSPENVSYTEQINDFEYLNSLLTTLNANTEMQTVRLYIPDGFIYSNQRITLFNLNTIYDKLWYKNIADNWTTYYFDKLVTEQDITFTDQSFLPVYFPIYSYNQYHKLIGVIEADFSKDSIINILKQINFSNSGMVYLTNSSGDILVESLSSRFLENENLYKDQVASLLSEPAATWINTKIGKNRCHAFHKSISIADWEICVFVSTDYIMQSFTDLRNQIFIISGIITLIVIILAICISNYNSKRLATLSKNMQEVENGNLNVLSIIDSEDEIGNLQYHFNNMVRTIRSTIKEQYELGQKLKNMELISLQNQINPHFLYNTLDMIYWTARKDNDENLCNMISDLANYYRKSLSKGKTFVTIKEEVEHVETYISIQNYRFQHKIRFMKNVEPDIYDKLILKLLLQPLVENSILHGIMEKPEKRGTIILNIHKQQNGILIQIIDDGVGFDSSLDPTQAIYTTNKDHGYGAWNINQRLHLYYGSQCSLQYKSIKEKGTTVCILIPTQTE